MPVHIENFEDIALRFKRLAFLGHAAQVLDNETGKRLVILALFIAEPLVAPSLTYWRKLTVFCLIGFR